MMIVHLTNHVFMGIGLMVMQYIVIMKNGKNRRKGTETQMRARCHLLAALLTARNMAKGAWHVKG